MSILFTSIWGAVYLTVLLVMMTPMLWRPNRRWLAGSMFLLFFCDRMAVNLLPSDLALFFLAFAYMLVTLAIVVTFTGFAAKILGGALLLTSIAFIAGGFGAIDWDTTGTAQEVLGLIAMLSIIWRRPDGARSSGLADDRADGGRRDLPAGASPRQSARK